jgi:hypothetical protein
MSYVDLAQNTRAPSDFAGSRDRKQSLSLFELVFALPTDAIQPVSARDVLKVLASFAGRGIYDPRQAWLMRASGYSERAVRDSLAVLEAGGWLTRTTCKPSNGPGRRACYLISEKRLMDAVTDDPPPWLDEMMSQPAPASPSAPAVCLASPANGSGNPAAAAGCPAECSSNKPADDVNKPANTYDTRNNARGREHARPCPSIHPSFLAYPWPSEDMKGQAALVLSSCGAGLADIDRYAGRMLGSLEDLLGGRWGDPAFLRSKVVPAVMKRTERAKDPEKQLKDFFLIDRNIDERLHRREQRQHTQSRGRAHGEISRLLIKDVSLGPPATDPKAKHAARISAHESIIDIIESGQRPEWTLDAEERVIARTDTEEAFSRALRRYRAEFLALQNILD